ncbi:MAG: hypothetical protein EOP47_19065 [Sphingobacteriaceae bacterium]|nr:MAG: hypothetical protein EOP47_19065 [Sphingobacteriaceae bacterium]
MARFLRFSVVVLCCMLLVCIYATAATALPNVIVIVADDLGAADINCYGVKDLITTNLDKLAASGLQFKNN